MADPVPGTTPRPDGAGGVAGFATSLRALKIHAGNPSLTELAKRSGVPRSTLADALNPERSGVPRLTVVTAFVEACGVTPQQAVGWQQAWRDVQGAADRRRINRADGTTESDRPGTGRRVPHRVAESTGRAAELTLIMADADGGVVVCAIDGAAGRGNTSLAARTAQSLTSSFPNVRSVTGQHGRGAGRDLFAARDALRTLLRALEGQ